ncbi:unnamed protein product [Symbiodinium natans]|uniref:Uncharacterized protein n=1 Tax=Symbiodinium natans TaxID=878477 RepID=A0A812UXV8_9DINO|nr:unnamed protein product [Symbiodinium natans]
MEQAERSGAPPLREQADGEATQQGVPTEGEQLVEVAILHMKRAVEWTAATYTPQHSETVVGMLHESDPHQVVQWFQSTLNTLYPSEDHSNHTQRGQEDHQDGQQGDYKEDNDKNTKIKEERADWGSTSDTDNDRDVKGVKDVKDIEDYNAEGPCATPSEQAKGSDVKYHRLKRHAPHPRARPNHREKETDDNTKKNENKEKTTGRTTTKRCQSKQNTLMNVGVPISDGQ